MEVVSEPDKTEDRRIELEFGKSAGRRFVLLTRALTGKHALSVPSAHSRGTIGDSETAEDFPGCTHDAQSNGSGQDLGRNLLS